MALYPLLLAREFCQYAICWNFEAKWVKTLRLRLAVACAGRSDRDEVRKEENEVFSSIKGRSANVWHAHFHPLKHLIKFERNRPGGEKGKRSTQRG